MKTQIKLIGSYRCVRNSRNEWDSVKFNELKKGDFFRHQNSVWKKTGTKYAMYLQHNIGPTIVHEWAKVTWIRDIYFHYDMVSENPYR